MWINDFPARDRAIILYRKPQIKVIVLTNRDSKLA